MMTKAGDLADVLRTPYVLGGREPGVGLDCLGTVIEIARRRNLCAPDPWRAILDAWGRGTLEARTGFPPCWQRQIDGEPIYDDDVLLFYGAHQWCAIVIDGWLWSADEKVGTVYRVPVSRLPRWPNEVWRHDGTAHRRRPK
jgi:hypothetical protein